MELFVAAWVDSDFVRFLSNSDLSGLEFFAIMLVLFEFHFAAGAFFCKELFFC